jgi:hypothetical protein
MPEPRSTTSRRDPDLSDKKEESLMHSMKEGKTSTSFLSSKLFVFIVIAALLGVGTGYFLSQSGGKTGIASLDQAANSAKIKKGQSLGSDDTKTFKDTAEGTIKKGGIEDEGSHTLIRPGGESQTVCLTSSHVDMDALEGRKVKVWGQTNSAETCGWLMDVGKIQVLN